MALVGDAAFVARPHVATGVMKAALDAETLARCTRRGSAMSRRRWHRYDGERQPYGAWLVERGRHIGATIGARDLDPRRRIETLMREYGAAGLVGDQPIIARLK